MENNASKVPVKAESLNVYNRELTNVVGALEVLSSTDKEVTVKLKDCYLIISGSGLSILKLIPEQEELSIAGKVVGIKYESKVTKKSLLGKVFK